ncbi:MAG: peptide MFS transporter [Bryobacterales bacterium]|nr:peptide MFS transporter [Bryobacterales bacterium]
MTASEDRGFFGQPRGLSTLFFTELWERFGYYGMRSLLVLFMVTATENGGLGFTDTKAYGVYGLYTASVYGMSLLGGWVADRILGQRRAVFAGGILIAIGYLTLAAPGTASFFSGLLVIILGTGLLKPNISTIVGQIYTKDDPRRDAGFALFYMGINIGAMIAPLICGPLGERVNWHLGFATAGIGMTIGVIWYWAGQHRLDEAGLHPVHASPEEAASQRRMLRNGSLGVLALLVIVSFLHVSGIYPVTVANLVNAAGFVVLGITLAVFAWILFSKDWASEERKRGIAIGVLFIASALFWSAFEQAGSSLSIFAKRYTDNRLLGIDVPASMYQSLNAAWLVVLSPVFAWLWLRLGKRQPASPTKFALALLVAGVSFVWMTAAAMRASDGVKVSPMWLIVVYLMHTVGELLLSPVGLSAMTRLAPVRYAGLMMGVWFLSLSMGNYLGGRMAALYGDVPLQNLFQFIAVFALAVGVVLALIARPVTRLMGDAR